MERERSTVHTADRDHDAALLPFSVIYENTPKAAWRCNRKIMLSHPLSIAAYALMSIVPAIGAAVFVSATYGQIAGAAAFVGAALAGGVFWPGLTWMSDMGAMRSRRTRFPNGAKSITSLTPSGVVDEMPEKTNVLLWRSVNRVRESRGDVFILSTIGQGCYIPFEAFGSAQQAHEYAESARKLWRSCGGAWTEIYGLDLTATHGILRRMAESDLPEPSVDGVVAAQEILGMRGRRNRLIVATFVLYIFSVEIVLSILGDRGRNFGVTMIPLFYALIGIWVIFDRKMVDAAATARGAEVLSQLVAMLSPTYLQSGVVTNMRRDRVLVRVLQAASIEDLAQLSNRGATRLYQLIRSDAGGFDIIAVTTLELLHRTLDTRALAVLRAEAKACNLEPVHGIQRQRLVRELLPLLEEQRRREMEGDSLLRPSAGAPDSSVLLHAVNRVETGADSLVRPAESSSDSSVRDAVDQPCTGHDGMMLHNSVSSASETSEVTSNGA